MSDNILDYSEKNGLVYCKKPESCANNSEKLYIFEALKLKAHAVLFRRFYKKEQDIKPYKSVPSVCIFKEEDITFNSKEHLALHAALWSSSKNEIYIISEFK